MTTEELQKHATKKRQIVKDQAQKLFKIPDGFRDEGIDNWVDNIITCMILETALLQSLAMEKNPEG